MLVLLASFLTFADETNQDWHPRESKMREIRGKERVTFEFQDRKARFDQQEKFITINHITQAHEFLAKNNLKCSNTPEYEKLEKEGKLSTASEGVKNVLYAFSHFPDSGTASEILTYLLIKNSTSIETIETVKKFLSLTNHKQQVVDALKHRRDRFPGEKATIDQILTHFSLYKKGKEAVKKWLNK